MRKQIRFDDRVVIVTGAGNGLGKDYAFEFAARGAKVVVNDLGVCADDVVREIIKKGGEAIVNQDNVIDGGPAIIKQAMDKWGRVDVIVNNAGIVRDKSFKKMTDDEFDIILKVHLRGTYSLVKAAWPVFLAQKYGRVVNVTSPSGLWGNFGQANYSAAKMGIVGLTLTLAKEGQRKGILLNCIAPNAFTEMTLGIIPQQFGEQVSVKQITPVVLFLASEQNSRTGKIYECGGGWVSETRMHQAIGYTFDYDFAAEDIFQKQHIIEDFEAYNTPEGNMDIFKSCTSRAGFYETRESMRETLQNEVGGQLGEYLAGLDRLLASKKGRFLVDSINSIFQVNLGQVQKPDLRKEEDELVYNVQFGKIVVFDFEEGRIHIGRVYKPTGGTLNFKGNQDCKRFLADGTIAENVFKGKNDQVEAFARLQQTKFCEILPFEWDHNEVLEKKKVEVAPPTPGATKEEEKEEDDYLANADETDEDQEPPPKGKFEI